MGLYNFKPQFVPFILSGEKRHTIRATRKNPDEPGDTMHLYTGLRQKGATLLMRAPCVKVEAIKIGTYWVHPGKGNHRQQQIWVNGIRLSPDERETLARRDGFESFAAMMQFWTGRLPFEGNIFHWNPGLPVQSKRNKELTK